MKSTSTILELLPAAFVIFSLIRLAIASIPPAKAAPASLIELQQQATDYLPQFDLKQTIEWANADFTKKYMEITNKEFPEIYQDIKSKSQKRMKELKENG